MYKINKRQDTSCERNFFLDAGVRLNGMEEIMNKIFITDFLSRLNAFGIAWKVKRFFF